MTEQDSRWIEMAYSAIGIYADDGTLDMGELNFLLGLALKDGTVDDDERRVLGTIFKQITRSDVSLRVWNRIQEIKRQHNV